MWLKYRWNITLLFLRAILVVNGNVNFNLKSAFLKESTIGTKSKAKDASKVQNESESSRKLEDLIQVDLAGDVYCHLWQNSNTFKDTTSQTIQPTALLQTSHSQSLMYQPQHLVGGVHYDFRRRLWGITRTMLTLRCQSQKDQTDKLIPFAVDASVEQSLEEWSTKLKTDLFWKRKQPSMPYPWKVSNVWSPGTVNLWSLRVPLPEPFATWTGTAVIREPPPPLLPLDQKDAWIPHVAIDAASGEMEARQEVWKRFVEPWGQRKTQAWGMRIRLRRRWSLPWLMESADGPDYPTTIQWQLSHQNDWVRTDLYMDTLLETPLDALRIHVDQKFTQLDWIKDKIALLRTNRHKDATALGLELTTKDSLDTE